jgi:tetratricopeptide (TPR) repeat protein
VKSSSHITLRASLRELENRNLSVGGRAELCCELAKQLENKGQYEEARKVLGDYWRRIGERPGVEGLEPSTAGEVLLRAGVLTGWIGSRNQFTETQETAKNLITESLTIFQSTNYRKKIAEAQTELALCYWRTGEINEARDLLNESLSYLTTHSELKAKAIVRLAIVECEAAGYSKALRVLTEHADLFQKINNETLKGSYHITLGTVLRHLWESKKRGDYLDRTLIEYAAASYHFERAEHKSYLANVENQLGLVYFTINRCDEAHEHLDRARRVLVSLRDTGGVAQVDETRANVFLKQGRFIEAEQAAQAAVYSHEKTGRHALLAEALLTHGKALARLKRYSASLLAFRRAFDLSEHTGSLNRAADAALAAFQEIGEHLAVLEARKLVSGHGLRKDKRLEHDMIKLALHHADGSVVHAAHSLGISYQGLTYMLNTRHKDLLKQRTPVRPRPRK